MISSPPFSHIDGKEGLDLALVCAAFEQQVKLIFVDQGVLHLIDNQKSSAIDDKLHNKQLSALEFYDIEQIYAETESLKQYSLLEESLIANVTSLNRQAINKICINSQQVINF